ncbi:MAG: hypothetical protein NT151_01055 [Acidobacteria bacterium]|nr:hypothetical protein [Acidobacteriota bacterium]
MNFGRLAAAALVSWLAHLALTGIVWGTVLPDLFRQHAALLRAPSDMNLVLGYGASLVGFFVFAYAYAKGYEGGAGLVEGLRYGVLIGLLLAAFAGVWSYVMMPISAAFAAAIVVDCIIEMAAYGAIVGLIYRPVAGRRPR